uniref:Uncharacterized protein n=1 Tax=Oryza sativa subsp. japonica TaxID=39947 RepID=Q69YD8_ORYSJ|nr:hypothetical protein [Oryza sativa Japonica Group]
MGGGRGSDGKKEREIGRRDREGDREEGEMGGGRGSVEKRKRGRSGGGGDGRREGERREEREGDREEGWGGQEGGRAARTAWTWACHVRATY